MILLLDFLVLAVVFNDLKGLTLFDKLINNTYRKNDSKKFQYKLVNWAEYLLK